MAELGRLIANDISAVSDFSRYAAILGENPSAGARSPVLWNAVFDALEMDSHMFPMDVTTDNLSVVLEILEKDPRFIGGAVAVPHKESIARWLAGRDANRLTPEAAAIGAVNCLYRDAEGRLCATNTDGEGALTSMQKRKSDLRGASVLLLGPGGAGKAVAAFVARAVGKAGRLVISGRRPEAFKVFSDRIHAQAQMWPPDGSLRDYDILINCTTIGSHGKSAVNGRELNLVEYAPLAALDGDNLQHNRGKLEEMRSGGLVFDIIYDPPRTPLLTLAQEAGLEILNGSRMNLEQAVTAFRYAAGYPAGKELDAARVAALMEEARS